MNDIQSIIWLLHNIVIQQTTAMILNTYDELEKDVLVASTLPFSNPHHYTVGPLHMMVKQIEDEKTRAVGSNLWVEESISVKTFWFSWRN